MNTQQRCILCSDTDRDGNPRERNWAAPGEQVCTGHAERLRAGIEAIPGEYATLTAAPAVGAVGARVSGTGEQPLGVRVPVLDLMSPANTGTVHDEYGDQTGDASTATVLAYLADDWIAFRGKSEARPAWTVPDLVDWLLARLDWAVTEVDPGDDGTAPARGGHPAIEEFAHDIYRVLGALKSANGNLPDPDDHKDGVECPRCDLMTLYDTGVYIECVESRHGCGKLMKHNEYGQWVVFRDYFLRGAIPCPSCGLCTLVGTRSRPHAECIIAKGGCGAKIPWAAYDKWAAGVAAVEKAGALLWGEHHPLPGPRTLQEAA